MSINVTVHGNPISINRGRMVALDNNKEFELRRKIRLQQVRQQSKRIAEEVRNKVREEKNKQLNKFGKEAEDDYRQKKNRKLTCLKQYYRGCLTDFGKAFGDAENEPDENEIITQINKNNTCQAEERGRIAEQKYQNEKEKEIQDLQKHVSNKKYARYIEDLRSKLVTDLSKQKKSKKKSKRQAVNIVINGKEQHSGECVSDSDLFKSILGEEDEDTELELSNEFEEMDSEINKESISDESKHIDLNDRNEKPLPKKIPVCPTTSKNNTTYNSHENYKNKMNSSKKKSHDSLPHTVDSIDKTVVSVDDFEVSYFDTPFEKDLENIVDSVSRDLDQQIENNYISDYKDGTKQPTNKPVYMKTVSPTKQKIVKKQIMSSPDRCLVRKTLTSQNSTPRISNNDVDQECLKIVSPIKVTRKVLKKSPKKLSRKKSSIHDTNYCSPTFIKKFQKNTCEHEISKIQNNVDRDEQIGPKHLLTHQLPKVPKTIIRPDAEIPTKQTNVACYDRFNRYSKEEPQSAVVKKISKESVDIISDHEDSDIEIKDMMCKKRDQDAKLRGNRALEKVKIHQDYQKLLLELPILQRQERLANMPMHKPTLHMNYERFQQYERKKQNAIDNKFENMHSKAVLFDRPPVTLKSIRKPPVCLGTAAPLKTLDITDENAVNVGSWEKAVSTSSEQNLSTADHSSHDTSSEAAIADLLKRVNKQRELLIKEAVNMKALGPLKDILNKDELINIICNRPPCSKLLIETGTSPFDQKKIKSVSSKQKSVTKSPKRSATSSSDTSIESKPKSKSLKIKPKVKKLKVVFREEATQTSPLIAKSGKIELSLKETVKESDQNSISTHSSKSRKTKTTYKTSKKASIKKSQSTVKTVPRTTSVESSTENSDKFCEIIIRTGDKNVKINPLTGETTCEPKVKKGSPKKDVVKIKEMNGLEVSTSTSYLSPPIELKSKEKLQEATHNKNSIEITRPSNKHLLQPQKQQTNLDNLVRTENGKKQINPRLVKYILRLLNMSRQSIDDLTISSVSDVSTPQESLIYSANNIARDKLQTVMEHFNLSPEDIKKLCSSSSSFSDINAELKKYEDEQRNQILKPEPKPCYPSQPSPKEDSKKDRREEVKDVCVSTSSNYEDSKSKNSTSHKPMSHVCSETQDSSSVTQDTKETSTEVQSSSRSTKAISPKCETKKRSPKSSPKSPVKVAVPKVDSTSEPYSTLSSSIQSNLPLKPSTSPKKQVVPKCPTTVTTSSDEIVLKDSKKFLLFVRESLGMTEEEFTDLGFEEMFSRHLELTEYCHDRIRSLMSLIEQIRNEKREICTSASPVDPSMTLTSYLELPPTKAKHQNQEYDVNVKNSLESDISSGTSISQEAIDRYLLGIGSDDELVKKEKELSSSQNSNSEKRLKSGESKDETDKQSFIPMLQGIPKYSDSKAASSNFIGELLQDMKPKPPPALLRSNLRGHTNEIPHELSTIVEADTLLSSRNTSMQRARSPEERIPSKHSSPRKICMSPKNDTKLQKQASDSPKLITRSPNKNDKSIDISSPTNSSAAYVTISPEKTSGSGGSKDTQQKGKSITSESANNTKSGISGIHSLSETSESDEIEMLLRKFKLDWAISLVKKTEQALALSSSSSSSEIRGKKDVSSDISVRESFREMCKKLASMNESDIERAQIVSDLSQHFREFHEISGIGGAGDSKNKSQQRTSTPVQHSKSTESKKSITNDSLFKVDSELSSVKNSSDENYNQLFLSIPNVTLNTEHISLIK